MDDSLVLPLGSASLTAIRQREKQARQQKFSDNLPGLYGEEGQDPPSDSPPADERPLRTRPRMATGLGDVEHGEVWVEEKLEDLVKWLASIRAGPLKRFAVIFGIVVLIVGGAAVGLNLYRRLHALDDPDPSRVFRDPHGRLIVDPWQPRMLEESSPAMAWIRSEARFWRMRTSQIQAGYGSVWLYGAGRMRNVSLTQLEGTLRESGHRCACAGHAGVPIHALYDRDMDAVMFEPRLDKGSDETRSFRVRDGGEHRQLVVPRKVWVDYAGAAGTKHFAIASDASVACLVQCCKMATGQPVVDSQGRIVRTGAEFDRDG